MREKSWYIRIKGGDPLDFYQILQEIMDEKGLNIPAVARRCNLSDATVRSIINRKQKNVALEVAFKLADGLQVSLERLNGNQDYSGMKGNLSDKEHEHIQKYRDLDDHGQEMVDIVLDKEHQRCTQPAKPALKLVQEPKEVVDLYEFIPPVSAGFGTDLTGLDGAVKTRVVSNVYTKQADFILRVSGESMAPRFHNNDKILVHETDDVDTGEIGVWMIDGKSYVKKKGEGRLISLNRKYPDVYPDETYEQKCQGRVVGVLDPSWIVEDDVEE